MENQWQHGWQRKSVGFVMSGENLRHVAEQPQRHGRVRRALVLEKEIKQGFPLTDADGKQQIRMHLLEAGFHERAGEDKQRWPVDLSRDRGRQMAFEKRGGVFRLREDGFEKTDVGVGCGDEIRFCHKTEIRLSLRRGQGSFRPVI